MAESGAEIIRTWFEEVWNKGRTEAIDQMTTPGWVSHGLTVPRVGESFRDSFKALHRTFRSAFPDLIVRVEQIVAEGDKVAAACSIRATHTGDGLGFTATGRPIYLTGVVIARFADGKVAESWDGWNFLEMHQQLGRELK